MQCKDIPDRPILEFLAALDPARSIGASWYDLTPREDFMPTVLDAMPEGIHGKLALAKMRQLIRRQLVDGCPCGCIGNFTITDKGRGSLDPPPTRA